MKKIIYIACLCTVLFGGCEDKEFPYVPAVSASVWSIDYNSAYFEVDYYDYGFSYKTGVVYGESSSALYGEAAASYSYNNRFYVEYLASETTYYYKGFIEDTRGNRIYSEMGSFTTLAGVTLSTSTFGNGITAAAAFGGGSGTSASPYLISNAQQLKKLVEDVRNGNTYDSRYFKLNTDINVTATEWIPIGVTIINSFDGSFDGDGHTVSGTLKSSNYDYFGFFGFSWGGSISNLTVTANVQNGYMGTLPYTGGIVGRFSGSGSIKNCTNKGTVQGRNYVGGIAGYNYGSIHTCLNTGNITVSGTGTSYAGGLVGYNGGHVYSCCTNTGLVKGQAASNSNRIGLGNAVETCTDGHAKR